MGNTLRGWRDVCRKLFRGSRVGLICERIIDRIEHYYGVVSNGTGAVAFHSALPAFLRL